MQNQIIQMINKRLVIKEMSLDGKRKRCERNICLVDGVGKNINEVLKRQNANKGIFQKMFVVIPIDKVIFKARQISKKSDTDNNG